MRASIPFTIKKPVDAMEKYDKETDLHKDKHQPVQAGNSGSGCLLADRPSESLSSEESEKRRSIVSKISKGGRSSKASSGMEETAVGRIIHQFRKLHFKMLHSECYAQYRLIMDNSKYRLLALAAIELGILGTILFVIEFVLDSILSSIRYYNLIHAVMSFQGKLMLIFGWELTYLVKKGFTAHELTSLKRGLPLTSVMKSDPPACRTVNQMFMGSLVLIETTLWVLSFFMDWAPVNTYLGDFECTTLSYNTPWNFASDMPTYVAANIEWGILDSFGLPLESGIIGGLASQPNAAPNSNFEMKGVGIGFAVNTICGDYNMSSTRTGKTECVMKGSEMMEQVFTAVFALRYPAGSHNVDAYSNFDITQECVVTLVTGDADFTQSYTADTWGSVTAAGIMEIVVADVLTLTPENSQSFEFGAIHQAFGDSETWYLNSTEWIMEGIRLTLNSTDLQSLVTRGSSASIFSWGVDRFGRYDPAATWKGVSAAVAVVAHYVLGQSDGTQTDICPYKGVAGYGTITAPRWIMTTALIMIILGIFMELTLIASWFLVVGGGSHVDKAIALLDNPLRLVYYMRNSAGRLIERIRGNDIGQSSLIHHLGAVTVRFGEDKRTRAEESGDLILDEPRKVVKISKNRKLS
ncbi:hypothetical protein BC830DRAFT_30848 [Chytriomyces sp. MP71]|nr:hypothetical protein BC830DRAFT_30848 [Chytriomyces sp. MP71]